MERENGHRVFRVAARLGVCRITEWANSFVGRLL